MNTSLASEQIGDAADCMSDAIETLEHLEKKLSECYRSRIRSLILLLEQNKLELHHLKGEVHMTAYSPVNSIFNCARAPQKRPTTISARLPAINF